MNILDELGISTNGESDQKLSFNGAGGSSSRINNDNSNKRKTKRQAALGKKPRYGLGEEENDSGSDFHLSDEDEETGDDDFEEVNEDEEEFNPFGEGESDDEDPWARGRQKKGRQKKKGKKNSKKPSPADSLNHLLKEKFKNDSTTSSATPSGTATPSYVPPPQTSVDRACQMKEDILSRIEHLGKELPPNTLDQLIDELGGPENVSEMTGRKGRVVQDQCGDVRYESRSEQVRFIIVQDSRS